MEPDCYPLSTLPGTTALFRDYTDAAASANADLLRRWYPADPFSDAWMRHVPALVPEHRAQLVAALQVQALGFGAGPEVLANIDRLAKGAAAVVTGQQVALFGGPLLTLLKAATAIRKARDATATTGREHVPIFWMASEDHDLAEVDQLALPAKTSVEKLRLQLSAAPPRPVGSLLVDGGADAGREHLRATLDRAAELLADAELSALLEICYAAGATLAGAFGSLLTRIFAEQGLIVLDAAGRDLHSLGAPVLRAAIEQAESLESALLTRTAELTGAGYHAQVLVTAGHSLLFVIDEASGARLPLRRVAGEQWKAGSRGYSTADLLEILKTSPERLSPNALLRPVFQDCILPTAAYIGGPAEIAYFAQSAVLYERISAAVDAPGRITPVLPRLSATLVEPAIASLLAAHELSLPQVLEARTAEHLAVRLGARAMPVEGKRKLAAAGNAMDTELTALTEYMTAMSPELGRSALVSASKMRYQMNRLRRLAARFELQKQGSLQKQAEAIMLSLFPDGHLQERVLGGIWFLARCGPGLPSKLVEHAAQECPGHQLLYL